MLITYLANGHLRFKYFIVVFSHKDIQNIFV